MIGTERFKFGQREAEITAFREGWRPKSMYRSRY